MLYLVGLGLHDVEDVSLKGLKVIQAADKVYAEFYTAILAGTADGKLEEILGRLVIKLDRLGVEKGAKEFVEEARAANVVLLTAGDPLSATTHADILLRCKSENVPYQVIHASSIFTAAPGLLGLQHYKFGRTTTLVRPEPNWMPTSPFDAVVENHKAGLHTLVLLDIKADENYFMGAVEGIRLLLELAKLTNQDWFNQDTQLGVVSRAGSENPGVVTGAAGALAKQEFGTPLHCIIVPGKMQIVEEEVWSAFQLGW